jgi:integrase/recombinase XerC
MTDLQTTFHSSVAIAPSQSLVPLATAPLQALTLPALASADPRARYAILEFFKAKIRNAHTRRAYLRAAEDFLRFAGGRPTGQRLETIRSVDVSDWVAAMETTGLAAPTIKQRLAAIRMLFTALMESHSVDTNPAAVVKGPRYSVDIGKTSVLTGEEVRTLFDSIDGTTLIGLRDRALIATMAYTFGRIDAALKVKVEDVIHQQRRLWLRLHEKRGKTHEVPCHRQLELYLVAYLDRLGISHLGKLPMFQTFNREVEENGTVTLRPTGRAMTQGMAWAMLQRRARRAGIKTHICNHTFRATGITAFLRAGGLLERAAIIANHASTRTTQLYDRRSREIAWAEIEQISF